MGLLCALLIVVRLSGAHWHLCLDQASPVITMQAAADPACGTATTHHDFDMDSAKTAAAKTFGGSAQDLMLLALFVAAWIIQGRQRVSFSSSYSAPAFITPAFSRHAPPRAPPL